MNEDAPTVVTIDREGNVKITAKKVELDAENVKITGKLAVEGDISSAGNIASDGEIEATGNVKGADFATPTLSFLGHTHVTAGTGAPTPPSAYTPPTN